MILQIGAMQNMHQSMMLRNTLYSSFAQLTILLLFFLIVWWVLKSNSKFGFGCGNDTAMDILKKRLAKGEITNQEFKKLKKEIE